MDVVGQSHVGYVDRGRALTGAQTHVLLAEHIAGAGLLGIADTMPQLHGPLHDPFALLLIDGAHAGALPLKL